jgi:REP element-mobilizing transposase RayT
MRPPLAYFITFTTYGTWLHGRESGSVDRQHNLPGTPFVAPDGQLEARRRQSLRQAPYLLDHARRDVVLNTICEVCTHRAWELHAVHVRSNHVHVLLVAPVAPEKVMSDLKAWCSRRLREAFGEDANRDRWTQHGSTRYLHNTNSVQAAMVYILEEQGDQMSVYDSRTHHNHPRGTRIFRKNNEKSIW